MAQEANLPIYEIARLWRNSEQATLDACLDFRRQVPPGWNLSWFRDSAPNIISGDLNRPSLIAAVKDHVPFESQKSVTQAVDLFFESIVRHNWKGTPLAPKHYLVPDGPTITIRPIGRYFSTKRASEFVLALQPRSGNAPNPEQLRIWHSAISYKYCVEAKDLDVMIIDLSKSPVSGKRQLNEFSSAKLKILDQNELNERLKLVFGCYEQAILILPEKRRPHRVESRDQKKLL
jgi:hypothetical protein